MPDATERTPDSPTTAEAPPTERGPERGAERMPAEGATRERTTPERTTPERTPGERDADHGRLTRLSDALLPALVQKLATSGLGELEVREDDWRVRLRRPPGGTSAGGQRRGDRPRVGSHGHGADRDGQRGRGDVGGAPSAGAGARAAESGAADGQGGPRAIDEPARVVATSPAVGIFRHGPPLGTRVRAGDRIAVVDVLGIPQEVASPVDGVLVEVFVEAGEAVEYGEEVATVEPADVDDTRDGGADGASGAR